MERQQERSNLPDIFTDDLSVPSETIIYNSKFANLFMLPFFYNYLTCNCPEGHIAIQLNTLATSRSKNDKLIHVYRGRNNERKR